MLGKPCDLTQEDLRIGICVLTMETTKTAENKPPKIARAVVSLRVSTDDQDAGLDAQLDACRAHCERHGLELVGPFIDDGVSGSTGLDKRPGLLEAIGVLEAGDILLVAKRDRIARDPIVSAMIESAVIRIGARVVSAAGEGTDGDDPASILFRRIIDAFAEYERLVIKARTRSALQALRVRGRRSGTLPYGKSVIDDGQPSKTSARRGSPLPSKLVVSEAEQEMIALIGYLHSAEGLSPRRIARELDERGYPTRRGKGWNHTTVRKILARIQIGGAA